MSYLIELNNENEAVHVFPSKLVKYHLYVDGTNLAYFSPVADFFKLKQVEITSKIYSFILKVFKEKKAKVYFDYFGEVSLENSFIANEG